jgi:ELWxxDGT repeat protein
MCTFRNHGDDTMKGTVAIGLLILAFLVVADIAAQTPQPNPVLLEDFNPGPIRSDCMAEYNAVFDGMLYMSAWTPTEGYELRKTDFSSVTLVKDISPSTGDGSYIMHSRGDMLLFRGSDGGGTGYELWKSDGTANGTVLVKDIFPGSDYSSPRDFVTLNGITCFAAVDETKDYRSKLFTGAMPCWHLYRTDGTTANTVKVTDFGGSYGDGIHDLSAVNTMFYFGVNQAPKYLPMQVGLGRSDGTVNGSTILVSTSNDDDRSTPGSGRRYYKGLGEYVLFSHRNIAYGAELWRTDGSVAGTGMLKDINPGSDSSNPSFLVPMAGAMYFTADDGVHGMELWRSDGTANGTVLVADILPGSGSSSPQWLTVVGGVLYFTANGGSEGRQLWKYDPSAQMPLARVAIINPNGSCESLWHWREPETHSEWTNLYFRPEYPDGMFAVYHGEAGSLFYFVANDGALGFELWQSDGTEAGTRMVKDICANCATSRVMHVSNYLDRIWFVADDGIHGEEPWVLDPSAPLDYVYNRPPVVSLSATPTQGTDPLPVSFIATASDPDPNGSITMYHWNFGDGTTDAGAMLTNPSHLYSAPGSYTATVTVTDNGSATADASIGITVTSANALVYVYDQTVTRVSKPASKWLGRDVVQVRDESQAAVSGAVVSVSYTGPNSGTLSGTTTSNGSVIFETPTVKNPSGIWCFTVTNIQASGKTFDDNLGEPSACESTAPKQSATPPLSFKLEQNYPNPFSTTTGIVFTMPIDGRVHLRVFDLLGREVRTVVDSWMPAGTHTVRFDARELPAGSYYLQLDALGARQTRVMMLQP